MRPNAENDNLSEFSLIWPDMLRGLAIGCVVIHHWFMFNPCRSSSQIVCDSLEFIGTVTGTAVHLFFILSGYGLTVSCLRTGDYSWKGWIKRRIGKILIPYWIVVPASFFLAVILQWVPNQERNSSLTWLSFISYITFTRNFYRPGWTFNISLWFMPVIVGLYGLFPLLIVIRKKFGILALLAVSLVVMYGSITSYLVLGYEVSHQNALPVFFLADFTLGILLAHVLLSRANFLQNLLNWKAFVLGICCYYSSYLMTRYWQHGSDYNDLLTVIGLFLMVMKPASFLKRFSVRPFVAGLQSLSKYSYLMYLIHLPLMLYIFKPLLFHVGGQPENSLTIVLLLIPYFILVYATARLISPPVHFATNLLLRLVAIRETGR
jgi:peptidoglycan/LPS O-acetylase OafA/YrhL